MGDVSINEGQQNFVPYPLNRLVLQPGRIKEVLEDVNSNVQF